MATMFGRFEIQSELSKSDTASIYKAMDTKSEQVVALKTQDLGPLGGRSAKFVETLIAEGESTRDLAHQTIVALYGAGEIEGQFCAAMEYIQGNSIATMLARKEGFSIWDLLDITRQVCAGLEHAANKGVVHCSLEPAKIMVQWDGMVKILGYGISNMSLIEAESGKGLGRLMPYCSPEQIRGEAMDLRANVYTLGAILYEMVVGEPAFGATDPVALVQQIENEIPASPAAVNSKIQPAVSTLIMKALEKDPQQRYQSARELLIDLENCKESGKKATGEVKKVTAATNAVVSQADRAAAAAKFAASASASSPVAPKSAAAPVAPRMAEPKPAAPVMAAPKVTATVSPRVESAKTQFSPSAAPVSETRAAAAAAGSYGETSGGFGEFEVSTPQAEAPASTVLSALVVEPETAEPVFERQTPELPSSERPSPGRQSERKTARVAADPMMSEPAKPAASQSFSDLAEMPPLKEPVYEPPAPEPAEPLHSATVQLYPRKDKDEKPKVQPREVAEKAFQQIATIPPRLMLFSILGAVGLILVIAMAVFFHVRSEDDGSTAAPRPTKAASATPAAPVAQTEAPRVQKPVAPAMEPPLEPQPDLKVRQVAVAKRGAKNNRAVPAAAAVPVVVAGQALIDSTPQGAQFQVDGKSDPSWVTPFTVAELNPGKHVVSVSKSGYTSDTRSVDVASGSKASVVFHLAPMNALMVLNSMPAGAAVIIDGKTTGRVTPAQFAVEKGSHAVLLRKEGYLDETVTADLGPGQNFQYAPTLRALGNTEDMRTVGKLNKLFGRGGDSTAGMGTVSIHTVPKGAQVAINQHMLDKNSPMDVMLGPGNYIVDITMTGFKPVHKIISVDKGGKTPIDEILERQ
jgi:serine/threonine-protein kinase